MAFGPKRWKCKDCGQGHQSDRKQCVKCGYSVLKPVDEEQRLDKLSNALLALLPALLSLLTMGALAWVLFF